MMSTHASLTLPRPPRAPADFTFRRDGNNPRLARFAKILLELGLLTDDDAPMVEAAGEDMLVEQAIRRWSENAIGGELTVLSDVQLLINDSITGALDAYNYVSEETPDIDPEHHVLLAMCPFDMGDAWILQRRCTAIEKRVPGLAQTALALLDSGLWRSAVGMTPRHAEEIANEQLYGWWEDDPEDRREGLTREDFEAAIPKWVFSPKQKLSRRKLEFIAHHEPVAHAALELIDALHDKKATVPAVAGWHSMLSVIVRWSDSDPLPQIADDYMQMVQNGGECTDDYSWHFIPLERAAAARTLDGYQRMLHTLACTDRLIALIAEPQARPLVEVLAA